MVLESRRGDGKLAASSATDDLLHFTQALEKTMATAKLRIDLVTRGAQPIGSETVAVAQAPSIGLFRVMLSEHPQYACHASIFRRRLLRPTLELVWANCCARMPSAKLRLPGRGPLRAAHHARRASGEQSLDPSTPLRLESRERDILDALRFTPLRCRHAARARSSSR